MNNSKMIESFLKNIILQKGVHFFQANGAFPHLLNTHIFSYITPGRFIRCTSNLQARHYFLIYKPAGIWLGTPFVLKSVRKTDSSTVSLLLSSTKFFYEFLWYNTRFRTLKNWNPIFNINCAMCIVYLNSRTNTHL